MAIKNKLYPNNPHIEELNPLAIAHYVTSN